jgi:uncharacterized protein
MSFTSKSISKVSIQVPSIKKTEVPVKSPCISVCALDGDNVCTGCFRTGDEISAWGGCTNEERRHILSLVHEREKKVNPFL